MAYVVPSGIIQLMKGVHLDNRYAHTIYFENETAQNTYFTSKVTHTFNAQSYTRHNSDVVRLKIAADSVADCTYLRFQNKNNGKWYYAFINYVDYINENVTAITFEIDVMQTWFFQTGHNIKPCFVDREHVSVDTFGIYHAPETPKTDEYVYNWIKDTQLFDNYDLVVQTSQAPLSGYYLDNNSYVGCKTLRLPCRTEQEAEDAATFIENALGGSWDKNEQSAYMVDMYDFPTAFDDFDIANNVYDVTLSKPTSFTYGQDTYTPKNKRLFSSPYSLLILTDYIGDNCSYEWEQFSDPSSIRFTLRGNILGGGTVICYPRNYAGLDNGFDYGIMINNFPKRAYSYDAYSAWVASGGQTKLENESKIVQMRGMARTLETVGDLMNVATKSMNVLSAAEKTIASGGLTAPSLVGQIYSTAGAAANAGASYINREATQKEAENNLVYQFNDAKYAPDVVYGSISSDIAISHRILDCNFISMFPKKDEAIRIDDFFSTYGYSIKEVKTPTITGRKHWNFLKTKGAVIGGNMPSSSRQAIADIIDGGIFFWKNGDEIGNFRVEVTEGSINNPILT